METITSIDQLVEKLQQFKDNYDVPKLLEATSLLDSEWQKYAFWTNKKERYSRNLIHEEKDQFQLFLICWQPGKGNKPHNHVDSSCFFKVLRGNIVEKCYHEVKSELSHKTDKEYKTGDICDVGDCKKIHCLKNTNEHKSAVTLHVYIKPTSHNIVYNKEGNTTNELKFISEYGKLIEEGSPWDIDASIESFSQPNYSSPRKTWMLTQPKQPKLSLFKKRYVRNIVSIISLGFSIASLIVVTLTFNLEKQNDGSKIAVLQLETFQKLCIHCVEIHDLRNESLDETLYTKNTVEGDNQCCASNEQELSNLFEMILKRKQGQDDIKSTSSIGKHVPISAHKKLFMSKESHDISDTHKVLHIDPTFNDNVVEHARGVGLIPTGIIIHHPGIYFVYSSILFQLGQVLSTHPTAFHYTHRVSPNNPSSSGVLLRTAFTADPNSVKNNESTFSGGVFYLLSGDIIQNCVSIHNSSTIDEDSSFTGLTMLSST
ncbi:hypothetical protein Btru_009000 [Bulinus truncatus]|nr:hypothetical protein Btru_009000 [Bulinus truncatus]